MTMMRRGQRAPTPFDDLVQLLRDDPWGDGNRWSGDMPAVPSLDMRETGDAWVIEAELPGVKPDDAEITLDGRTLVIRGRYGPDRNEDDADGRWILRERRSGSYARAITLPTPVDADKIECSFEHGELRLTLPKAQESRARRIPVGGGGQGARQVGDGEGRAATDKSDDGGQR